MPDPTPKQLQAVFDQVVKTYSHRENVTGVDVGFRYDKGKRTNEMAVRIHVREKIPEHAHEANEIFGRQRRSRDGRDHSPRRAATDRRTGHG